MPVLNKKDSENHKDNDHPQGYQLTFAQAESALRHLTFCSDHVLNLLECSRLVAALVFGDLSPSSFRATRSNRGRDRSRPNKALTGQRTPNSYFFFTAFISDSRITGAGPEIPPSLRIRQKCTAMKIEATRGMPIQCQI